MFLQQYVRGPPVSSLSLSARIPFGNWVLENAAETLTCIFPELVTDGRKILVSKLLDADGYPMMAATYMIWPQPQWLL